MFLAMSGMAIGTEGVMIGFTPSISMAVTGVIVTVLIGLVAGIVPAWQASRAEIVTALREG